MKAVIWFSEGGDMGRRLAFTGLLSEPKMGAYDGGETCDICVLYLLSKLQHLNINIGAYKDDWLAVSSQTARNTEKTRQELENIFREYGLTLRVCCCQ